MQHDVSLRWPTRYGAFPAVMLESLVSWSVSRLHHLHRVRKKGATLFLPVTPRNSNRFSKFFYLHALQ